MLISSLFPLNKSSLECAQSLHSFAAAAVLFTEFGRSWENKTFIHKVRTFLPLMFSVINPKHCQTIFSTYRVYLMIFSHPKYGPVILNAGATLQQLLKEGCNQQIIPFQDQQSIIRFAFKRNRIKMFYSRLESDLVLLMQFLTVRWSKLMIF